VGTFETSFLIALPISPTNIFFAFNNEETLENLKGRGHDEFVRAENLSTTVSADRYVFSTNARQEHFVQKFLRVPIR